MAIQRSFSSGEVDPALYGRADVDRWKAALKECTNWIVQPEGGILVRQGFELCARFTYTNSNAVKMLPFEYGPSDSLVLAFADNNLRIVREGALVYGDRVRAATVNIGTTPWTVTMSSHGYATGDTVTFYSGFMYTSPGVDVYTITNTGTNTFTLVGTIAGGAFTGTTYMRRTALASGSAPVTVYNELWSGVYSSADYQDATYVQSGDTIFFANIIYPAKLIRNYYQESPSIDVDRALSFSFETINGYPTVSTTASLGISGTAGSETLRYRVTYTNADGVESAVLRTPQQSGTCTGSDTITVTSTAHGLLTNDSIIVGGSGPLFDSASLVIYDTGDVLRVVVTGVNTFTIPGNGRTTTGTLYFHRIQATSNSLALPTTTAPVTVAWTAVTGAVSYNVYREFGRYFGYIGSTSGVTFRDFGIVPDTKDNPTVGISPWLSGRNRSSPRAVGLFQQRLMFGGFDSDPERVVGSYIGDYTNYDVGAGDSSAIDFVLAGRTVSGIQHLVEVAGRSIVLADTAEWVLRGGTGGGLTPTAINARTDSYYGVSDIPPALIGSSLIYVQRGNRIVREARYDFSQEALASNDLTLWAKHLFIPGVKRICYQRTAQILWALRDDGVLLGLTYVPEQNIWGWHKHQITGRDIHDICVVSEDGYDRLYICVVDATHANICRLPLNWESGDPQDHIGFDMSLTYNGDLTAGTGLTGTLTGGTNWTTDETLTLTANGGTPFVVGDVGKDFLLESGDDMVYVRCTAYTSSSVVSVRGRTLIPTSLRGVASTAIARCADTFTGLTHLEGATVGVIADGSREANAVVASGSITTARKFARVQVGLPITATAKTLDLESDDKDTLLGDFKHVTRVYLRVRDTRGLTVGIDEDHLNPFMPEYEDLVNGRPTLRSGTIEVLMDATHEDSGSVTMVQDTGLPANILNARPVFNAGELK